MDNKTREISKEPKNSKKKDIFSILRLFFIKYPKAFNKKEPQPLKLGILEDIAEDLQGELTKSQIRKIILLSGLGKLVGVCDTAEQGRKLLENTARRETV